MSLPYHLFVSPGPWNRLVIGHSFLTFGFFPCVFSLFSQGNYSLLFLATALLGLFFRSLRGGSPFVSPRCICLAILGSLFIVMLPVRPPQVFFVAHEVFHWD